MTASINHDHCCDMWTAVSMEYLTRIGPVNHWREQRSCRALETTPEKRLDCLSCVHHVRVYSYFIKRYILRVTGTLSIPEPLARPFYFLCRKSCLSTDSELWISMRKHHSSFVSNLTDAETANSKRSFQASTKSKSTSQSLCWSIISLPMHDRPWLLERQKILIYFVPSMIRKIPWLT